MRKRESDERYQIQSFLDEREPIVEQIYGTDAEKEEIVQLLIDKSERDLLVVSIDGKDGIGKTTLARLAFDDKRVQTHFELKLWIENSGSDCILTARKIIEAATGSECKVEDRGELQRHIEGMLVGTLFLLVLEDILVGNDVARWLKTLSSKVASGSRIILEVRPERSSYSLLDFQTNKEFHLCGLPMEDCWALFCQRAFGNRRLENYPKLETIGRDIVKMCNGSPLFVKMFGGLLYFQRKQSEWELVREGMIQNSDPDSHLRLCFSHLKPHLQHCFAFCALFPECHEIDKGSLIQLWMANGLVPPNEEMELEDVGHEIFGELVIRSFFQNIQQPFGDVTTFMVHNLLHGLARRAMGKDCCYVEDILPRFSSDTRHLSLAFQLENFCMPTTKDSVFGDEFFGLPISQVRTIVCLPLHAEPRRLHAWRIEAHDITPTYGVLRVLDLSQYGVLRVLDLRGWKRDSLPTAIGNLRLLRYIDLSYASVMNLPESMSALVNLQTLKLCECQSLRQLPEGMKYMINLRYLDIRGCNLLTHMPPKIGQLHCLRVLNLFIVGGKTSSCSGIEELGPLNLRGSLHIRHLERVRNSVHAREANLLGKPNLNELYVYWRDYNEGEMDEKTETEVLESLQPHQKLEKLQIRDYMGTHFPSWLMRLYLQNLVEIRLYGCRKCEYLPPLGQLPLLKILHIESLDALEYIGNEFYGGELSEGFPSLETLEIKNMSNLQAWLECQGKRAFLRLSKLTVAFCDKLTTMPCFPSIKDLFLDDTDSMLFSSVTDCTSLSSLTIQRCSGLMSLPKELLQNLMSLKSLTISRCENLSYLPTELRNLTSLEHFTLSHCAKLESLPEEGIQGLASLKELKIEHCENLRTLSEGLQYLTNLQLLHVNWCDELEYLPDGLQYLINLKHLRMFYCHGLKILAEEIGNLSSLEVLAFGSPKLESLPGTIGSLSSLQVLMIGSLSLTSLPDSLQQLTTLRQLFVGNCPQLVSLPEWLENFTLLNSLWIISCPNMKSLPAGLQRLTLLRRLLIRECPNLSERCEVMGEDWHKIQHIPVVEIE